MADHPTPDVDFASHATSAPIPPCISAASFQTPLYLVESAWHEHSPFAFWLVEALRPKVLVELGVHTGFSYLTFCQAIRQMGLQTLCYGVDTWTGDEHTGFYGEDVFTTLSDINDEYYSNFSHLIRKSFKEALSQFKDRTIDLLHIDGQHNYESVMQDFQDWSPKLTNNAIVLLHDTNTREGGFEVWRRWEELASEYPTFEFSHGCGLGILASGGLIPERLNALFIASPNDREAIRNAYARLGTAVSQKYKLNTLSVHKTNPNTRSKSFAWTS